MNSFPYHLCSEKWKEMLKKKKKNQTPQNKTKQTSLEDENCYYTVNPLKD
jgi:hypothetical protein